MRGFVRMPSGEHGRTTSEEKRGWTGKRGVTGRRQGYTGRRESGRAEEGIDGQKRGARAEGWTGRRG